MCAIMPNLLIVGDKYLHVQNFGYESKRLIPVDNGNTQLLKLDELLNERLRCNPMKFHLISASLFCHFIPKMIVKGFEFKDKGFMMFQNLYISIGKNTK